MKIQLASPDRTWPDLYCREADGVRSILGDRVLELHHTGSTAVPGLPAKPIVDMLLVVKDSSAEAAYAYDLEHAGYSLVIREPEWYEHRMFKGPDTDINLHVFSADCEEIGRILLFRDWLRARPEDRELYARVKRELSQQDWNSIQAYADAKTAVVQEILGRATS